MNKLFQNVALATSALIAAGSLAACGPGGASASADESVDKLTIMVPADPGGGWDSTGRALQDVIETNKLAKSVSVSNVPGAGGTVGLAQLANERDPNTLMMMGLVMVGAIDTNHSSTTLADTTPVAELTEEQEAVVVPADSPYTTINDLVDDIKAKGQGVSVAGGSAGGTDQITAGQLLKAAGVPTEEIASKLNYVPFDGGAESVTALLGGKVDAGISGVSEYAEQVKAGKLRALAVSGDEEADLLPGVPTFSDQGIDLVITNWRGVVAPGTISDAKAEALADLVTEAVKTDEWKKALEENGWTDSFRAGAEFGTFMDQQAEDAHQILVDIGLVK